MKPVVLHVAFIGQAVQEAPYPVVHVHAVPVFVYCDGHVKLSPPSHVALAGHAVQVVPYLFDGHTHAVEDVEPEGLVKPEGHGSFVDELTQNEFAGHEFCALEFCGQ